MNSRKPIFMIVVALFAALVPAVRLAGQEQPEDSKRLARYRVIDLGTLGGTFSDALGINDKGWVDGFAAFADGTFHAFLWREGVKTDLGTLGGPNSTPNIFMVNSSVNQKGEIVGAAATSTVDPLGEDFCIFGDGLTCLPFLWQDGGMTPLSTLGGNNGAAFQINNRSQAVGEAENAVHDPTCVTPQVLQFKPVLWENGEIRELPTVSGDPDGAAFAINDRGQAVGVSSDCTLSASHAVLWQEGTATDLGTLGDLALAPGAINNKGQVVGSAFNGPVSVAFLWEDGVASGLGSLPGDVASFGSAINDKGQVVGQSCDMNGNCRVFLWQQGGMIDLDTLISPNASLHLFDGLGINSRGEIVGAARLKKTGEFRAFLATACDEERAVDAACADREGTMDLPGETRENWKAVLPENPRQQLQQRTLFHHYFPGFRTPSQ